MTTKSFIDRLITPIKELTQQSKVELVAQGKASMLESSRYRKQLYVSFTITSLNVLKVPTSQSLQLALCKFIEVCVLNQYATNSLKFDFFIVLKGYTFFPHLDKAVQQFVYGMVDQEYLKDYKISRNNRFRHVSQALHKIQSITNFNLIHQLISINMVGSHHIEQIGILPEAKPQEQNKVVLNERGQVFDIDGFGKGCLRVLENLIFFSEDRFIRAIQMESNRDKTTSALRLMDYRPLLQNLWIETITFVLNRPCCEQYKKYVNQEQIAILFTAFKQDIEQTFNKFVLGTMANVIQPHPVRALLTHTNDLIAYKSFDVCCYNIQQYGLNVLCTAYFIAKNFLTDDNQLTNSHGAICLSGVAGSGKSKLQTIIAKYMNGFFLQDSGKGISEFQNHDIVNKSCIKVEEIELKRLMQSDWKMLADIESEIKCRVKNQPDVSVTKFVPVIATTNGNVYTDIISRIHEDFSIEAVHRRWIFIRFFESWTHSHLGVFNADLKTMSESIQQIYQAPETDKKIMNTLIGLALIFYNHTFALPQYIIKYYSKMLVNVSNTLFGQVVLKNYEQVHTMVMKLIKTYSEENDFQCINVQRNIAKVLESLCYNHIKEIIDDKCVAPLFWECGESEFYIRGCLIQDNPRIEIALKEHGQKILDQFLTQHKDSQALYRIILANPKTQ